MSYPQTSGRVSVPVKKITSLSADTPAISLTIYILSPGLCFQPLYLQAIVHQRVYTPQDTRPALSSVQINTGSIFLSMAFAPVLFSARNFRLRNPVSTFPDSLQHSPGNQPCARPKTTGHLSQKKISRFFSCRSWSPTSHAIPGCRLKTFPGS